MEIQSLIVRYFVQSVIKQKSKNVLVLSKHFTSVPKCKPPYSKAE